MAVPIKKPHGSSGAGAKRNAIAGQDGEPMFTLDRDSQHAVMILASRGRGGHNLEYRDDGIANAVLTPNGGRAGIGVGSVAVQCNGSNVGFDLPSLRRGNGHLTGGGPAVASGMSVRDLPL